MTPRAGSGPVALLSALTEEIEELRHALDDPSVMDLGGIPAQRGTLDGHDVVLAETGIGKVNAAVTTTLVIERFAPRMAVFTGVAGGLDPNLHVGDVVIARIVAAHDSGVLTPTGLRRYQPGHVPFLNPTDRFGYAAHPETLVHVAERLEGFALLPVADREQPPRVVVGTVLTGDQFVNDPAVRQALHGELGGQAVEMEGAALTQTAERLGVPHLVIRSLSDLAGAESDLDFSRFVRAVSRNSARLVRRILPAL